MSDELSPIARTLLGGDDFPDREITCCVCGEKTTCPGFIWESVKLWNHEEVKIAAAQNRRVEFIKPSDMGITCGGECASKEWARRHADYQAECNTTMSYLAMLRAGKYNPESLAWLRNHGHAKDVTRILAEEGKKSA